MADSREQGKQLLVGDYVVCLVDILGQTDRLKRWPELPAGCSPSPELIDALRETAGTVMSIRRLFEGYFSQWENRVLSERVEQLTEKERDRYVRAKDYSLSTRHFSDTLVFYAPESNDYGDVTMRPMLQMLLACGTIMAFELSIKVPLRGALSVGSCMELESGDPYGPVLAEAHHIESEVACYPRIVVSDAAVEFARANFPFSPIPQIDQLSKDLGEQCRSLMCKDTEGQTIIDFLGKGMRDFCGSAGDNLPVRDAYQFVQSEAERFVHSNDKKHADRYQRLLRYMKSRLPIWGLSPEELGHGG